METDETVVIAEWESSAGDSVFRALRDFYINTGPVEIRAPIVVRAGQQVRLTPGSAEGLLRARKVRPAEIGEIFACIRGFQHTDSEGRISQVRPGDTLRLTPEEAVDLIQRGIVKQKTNVEGANGNS